MEADLVASKANTSSMKDTENAKNSRFRELAEARTNRALDDIRKIGNLSNKQMYTWEEAEVRKICRALREATAELEAKFAAPAGKGGPRFKF